MNIYRVMDDVKLRKSYAGCKQSTPSDTLPSAQKPCNKKKGRHKGNACQLNYPEPYEMGFTPYGFNIPSQARIHPPSQRLFQTTDTSICHYPVTMSFPFDHVPVPFYSTLIQAGTASTTPFEKFVRINRTREQKMPATFQTLKQNRGIEQDYASLPPVNCQLSSKQSKDYSASKRRFSDPGLAQISSDECSNSRSSENSKNSSLQDLHMPYEYGLIDQVNELRQNNSNLTRELHEVKLELESLKLLASSWTCYTENLQPGKLSDSIVEVRDAMKLREETMMDKITSLFEKNAAIYDKMHRRLEETVREKVNEKVGRLEEKIQKMSESLSKLSREESASSREISAIEEVSFIQQQLVDSEREKISLRKELQEAIDSKKEAEAQTLKLERLVLVLWSKINGVSNEACLGDDKQAMIQSSSFFEQDSFIIANNINSNKNHQLKRCLASKKIGSDMKENGTGKDGECEPGLSEVANIPQVTITGPVTDL